MNVQRLAVGLFASLLTTSAFAAGATSEGYLCCNMRTDGSWVSDINYVEGGKRVIPVGTPVKVRGQGRYRINIEINGAKQSIGNDYSRDLSLDQFEQRYIVKDDPAQKLATFPAKIREAIQNAKVMPGMTREQVFMAVGYPVSSENPSLDAKVLRFWLDSFNEFQLIFDQSGRVKEITADSQTRNLIVQE
jgi:hypothetical protein